MFFAMLFFGCAGFLFALAVWNTVVLFAGAKDVPPSVPILGFVAALLALAAAIVVLQQMDTSSEPVPPAVSETYHPQRTDIAE